VLVAFAILAASLGAMLQVFSAGLRSSDQAERYTRAVLLAESTMASIGTEENPLPGGFSGETEDGFQWRWEANPYDEGSLPDRVVALYRVNVTVTWEGRGKNRTVSLTTLRLAPLP
jgi:general secretion pathway protein I